MDQWTVERTLDQLIAWGLVEQQDDDVHPTRRWVAKLQAATEKLNILVQQNGGRPFEGNPLVLSVQQALANENLTDDEGLFTQAVQLLVILELSRMTSGKRAQYGFADVTFS
ncbi:MAG: hypothetical protein WDA16_07220 [Candidatus Thermoplasmatota archaeon]